jgi:uncharacterized protein
MGKDRLYPESSSFRMSDHVLEAYITQHIEACTDPVIRFSWHGGEPTALGLDYFRKIVELQHKYRPSGRRILNGIQTNGILLDEEWCGFLAAEQFEVGLSLDGPKEFHDAYRVDKDGSPTFTKVSNSLRMMQNAGLKSTFLPP